VLKLRPRAAVADERDLYKVWILRLTRELFDQKRYFSLTDTDKICNVTPSGKGFC
jgi:hypothetical protein